MSGKKLNYWFKHLEPKHLLALLLAVVLSMLIIYFQKEIQALGKYGYLGVFLVMFLSSLTVMLPTPVLVLNILFGRIFPDPLLVGIVIGLASALGEIAGYLAGWGVSGVVKKSRLYHQTRSFEKKYGLWSLFFLSLFPNPAFDLAGLAAGALGIRWWRFLLAVGAGKVIRSVFFAYLGAATKL